MATLGQLAEQFKLELHGDPNIVIDQVAPLSNATAGTISFLSDDRYQKQVQDSAATAIIVSAAHLAVTDKPRLVAKNPKLAFAHITAFLNPPKSFKPGVHKTAIIDPSAEIDETATIGPYVTIGAATKIAANVIIEASCHIDDNVCIEANTHLFPRVTVYAGVKIGQACSIHSGTVIGSDGFGFAHEQGRWTKVPQVGSVVIGDQVDIGANTTIDRGALEDTRIGSGCILDNLIQVGHNVIIGEGTAIAACVAIAGSATIGRYCLIGGGSIINGHLSITDKVQLAGNAQVANDIKKPGAYGSAITAREMGQWKRNLARFHHLDELSKRVKALEKNQ